MVVLQSPWWPGVVAPQRKLSTMRCGAAWGVWSPFQAFWEGYKDKENRRFNFSDLLLEV